MTTFILSFFLTSLIMSILIFLIWIIHNLAANIFTAKLRYITWIVILIGFLIPLRISIGNGVITLPPLNQPVALVQQELSNDAALTLDNQANVTNEDISAAPLFETNEIAPETNEPASYSLPNTSNTPANNLQTPYVTTAETSISTTIINFLTTLTLLRVILAIWAIGVVGILSFHIIQYSKFHRQVKRWGEQEEDTSTWEAFHKVLAEMGIAHKKINLMTCPFITSSMLTGLFKPVILLPERNFDQDELALIFKHELVHYKRRDLFIKFLSLIAIAIHWYNPFIYILSRQMQAEGEASCDEYVLKNADLKNRHFYAEVIIGMIGKKNKMTFLATNFYGGKLDIKKRLTSVIDTRKKFPIYSYGLLAIVLCITIFSGSVFATSIYEHSATSSERSDLTQEQAEAIAISYVGGGTIIMNENSYEHGVSIHLFLIRVLYRDTYYQVEINRQSGVVTGLFTILESNEVLQSSQETITMEAAVTAAQAYLSLANRSDATLISAYLTTENDLEIWNIKFSLDGTNYDFDIDALTGDIILAPEFSNEELIIPPESEIDD